MPKKILIAEDDAPIAKALKLKLMSLDYDVTVASDGRQAMEEIKGGGYDLLLLDLMMPKLDGFGVLDEIKELKKKPIVFVNSNLSQPDDKQKALDKGADKFLVKSDVSLKEIVENIKSAL